MIVLGLMSGTSLDGLDLALCEFKRQEGSYSFKLLAAKTVEYSVLWKKRLNALKLSSAEHFFEMHAAYATFCAEEIKLFLKAAQITPRCIASHGHTVFHQPKAGFSTQLGCGATIAAQTGITTVCDFRNLDVALKGQGAPLVPIGDKFLFSEYAACLNIGGIANISFDLEEKRIAYDVCEANMLLNNLAERNGKAYDNGGQMARAGKVNAELLEKLNNQNFYMQRGAKSLGREWFEANVENQLDPSMSVNDLLATATEHVAMILSAELNRLQLKNILVTGGGAFNKFLLERIRANTSCKITVPKEEIVNYKEALVFAFLGYLRLSGRTNTLASVTGADRDSIGGAVYQG